MNMMYEVILAKIARSMKLRKEECEICSSRRIPDLNTYLPYLKELWRYSCQAMLNRLSRHFL